MDRNYFDLPVLARIWFNNPLQHAIIVRNIKRKSKKTQNHLNVRPKTG